MKLKTEACFRKNSISGIELMEIFEKTTNIKPNNIEIGSSNLKSNSYKLDLIKSFKSGKMPSHIYISEKDIYSRNVFMYVNSDWLGIESIYWKIEDNEAIKDSYFNEVCNFHGCLNIFQYDNDFVLWQSEKSVSRYIDCKRPYEHLPIFEEGILKRKLIDISVNPGRSVTVNGLTIMAAWKTWFAPSVFPIFPKEKLLRFENAFRIEELNNGSVFVQLYKNVADSEKLENLNVMQKFRNFMNMEGIELRKDIFESLK
jgi:hypothetical protein